MPLDSSTESRVSRDGLWSFYLCLSTNSMLVTGKDFTYNSSADTIHASIRATLEKEVLPKWVDIDCSALPLCSLTLLCLLSMQLLWLKLSTCLLLLCSLHSSWRLSGVLTATVLTVLTSLLCWSLPAGTCLSLQQKPGLVERPQTSMQKRWHVGFFCD